MYSLKSQVEHAYRIYSTGDFIEVIQSFNNEFWGPRTTLFMEYISKDLTGRHWDSIFRGAAAVSVKATMEAAVEKGVPQASKERVPLPPSDPPLPPAQD